MADAGPLPAPPATLGARLERRLFALLVAPRLGRRLALCAVLLSAPSLFIGWQLDDHFARFIYSELPDAARLYDFYAAGYGIANGNPADNLWQIEHGHLPWWAHPALRLQLYRPISLVTHLLDARLAPEQPLLQHAQSLVWFGLLVLAVTRLYRGLLPPLCAGMAALLFALDHTHGFAVGFISNRHALVTALIGVLCLDRHVRARGARPQRIDAIAVGLYALTLLAGESGVAICGYLFAFALCVERGSARDRVFGFAPYLAITLIWRIAYERAGYGAFGSGLYVDPGRDPLHFAAVFLRRAPFQWLGQLFLPPAELYWTYGPHLRWLVWGCAVVFGVLFVLALVPLLRRDRVARGLALGFALSLVPATAGYPSGRQLMLSGLGALGLIAQLWQLYAIELRGRMIPRAGLPGRAAATLAFGTHLVLAPFALPLASCGVALSSALARAADDLGPEIAGKDVVLINSPDFFAVRLAQLRKRVEGAALPRRWRALAAGPGALQVRREDARTLVVDYAGGVIANEALEFFRDRRARMRVGERIGLEGLDVEVLALGADQLASRVRFRFDADLDAPSFRFYVWRANGYAPFELPAVGRRVTVPGAELELGM